MEVLLAGALAVLAVAGAGVGVLAALRSGGPGDRAHRSIGTEQGLERVTAAVHTGWEQTLIGLIRELGLPRRPDDLRYGQLYLEMQDEQRILIRSRSVIERGFVGVVDLQPRRGVTHVRYAIVRLPGDDDLHAAVLELELRLIAALRRLDPDLDARLSADALRHFGSTHAQDEWDRLLEQPEIDSGRLWQPPSDRER